MKTFKITDCVMQAILILLALLVNLSNGTSHLMDSNFFFLSYFVVGGWQVLSMFIHFTVPKKYKIKQRKIYIILLLLTIIAGVLCLPNDTILNFMLVLLFWSPALALLYFIITVAELRMINRQEDNGEQK